MSVLFETATIQKRNILNELRSNNMTLQELRLFSIYLSKINKADTSTRVVRFPLDDFRRIMGLGLGENIYNFKYTVRHILQQVVEVPNENGKGYSAFQLFKKAKVEKDEQEEWYVELDAHDDALPLMFEFKNKYFNYKLWNALRLKSPNQVRMYEILKQYEDIGKRTLTITELRELLGIGKNEYSGRTGWSDFKKKVLDSCQKALKESTDICYTYERGKAGAGGKWLTIIFYIKKNNDYIDPLTLDEFIDQTSNFTSSEFDFADDLDEDDIRLAKYGGDEYLATLAEAVNDEFSKEDMEQIRLVLARIDVPEDHNFSGSEAVLWGRHQYLQEKYAALNAEEKRKKSRNEKIGSRFNYFLAMLEKDTFKPAAYNEKGE